MRKQQELNDPKSCLNMARENELTFVLLGRDIAAPAAIRAWVGRRLMLGKNRLEDRQIAEALDCATRMELERTWNRGINADPA